MDAIRQAMEVRTRTYSFRSLLLYFLKLGTIGFGGPIALVGRMQNDLVEERGWLYTVYGGLDWMQALFLLCGVIAMLMKYPLKLLSLRLPSLALPLGPLPFLPVLGAVSLPVVLTVFFFFAKAGAFVFGSGLAIVPFLYGSTVEQYHWLTQRQFLDAVAVAMITPGPVVITVGFIGYLVAGVPGAVAAAFGVFLPVYFVVLVLSPFYERIAANPRIFAFVQGVTAAATGAIAGAVIVLGKRAIVDLPTALIALVTLLVIFRFKVPEPVLVIAAGLCGLLLYHAAP